MTNLVTTLRRIFTVAAPEARPALCDDMNHLDLAFVVDTTSSMTRLIHTAQQQMIATIGALSQAARVDLRIAVVEYRDHPPQDTLVFRVHTFTGNLDRAQATINRLKASGGGDMPEAVLDGVLAACRELTWRPYARRIAVLIGDAPPHANCACGETIESVTAAAEQARITLYALGLTNLVTESFGTLSHLTGGEFFSTAHGDEAIARLRTILEDEFGNLAFDQRVVTEYRSNPDITVAELGERLGCNRATVAAAMSRLSKRQLI